MKAARINRKTPASVKKKGVVGDAPWLLGFAAVIIISTSLIFAFFLVSYEGNESPRRANSNEIVFSAAEKGDKLAIMNLLNAFSLTSSAQAGDTTRTYDDNASKLQQVQQLREKLQTMHTTGPSRDARDDLVGVLNHWYILLQTTEDDRAIRDELLGIGKEHPWLDTLMWLIVLNKL